MSGKVLKQFAERLCKQKAPTQREIETGLDEWFKAGFDTDEPIQEIPAQFENNLSVVKQLYNWYTQGHLPEPGGILDQDASLMRDISLMKHIESERYQKWLKYKQQNKTNNGT